MYDSINGATIASKRIKLRFATTRSQAQEIAARAAGYQDWHQLVRVVGSAHATTTDAGPNAIAAYLAAKGLDHIDANDALDVARPEKPLYYLRSAGLDPDFYPFNDIRPFLERDIERFALAVTGSKVTEQENPDPETDDDEERDHAVHFMELREYTLKGAVPNDMTARGHLMATSEYYTSTYWSLIPSDTKMASVSIAIDGTPEETRDPLLALRTWRRVVDEVKVEIPREVEEAYERICQRTADRLAPMLPAGKTYRVRIDGLRSMSIEIATDGIGMSLDEIYEGFDLVPGYAATELCDLPRAFHVEETFTNHHLVFPTPGVTYGTDGPLDSTVYFIDGEEKEFTNARSYRLYPHSTSVKVMGTAAKGPNPDAPLRPRENHWADKFIDISNATITIQ